MWHWGAFERHFGDHLKRKRTSFRAIPPQFPWNRPWNFLEVNGSQFRGECNFDVQGSHESFVFDLMHSHSEEDAYPQTTFSKLYLFKLCNFGHRYDSRLLWKENPPKRKPNRFSPWTSQMHISHVQITVFLLLLVLLVLLVFSQLNFSRWQIYIFFSFLAIRERVKKNVFFTVPLGMVSSTSSMYILCTVCYDCMLWKWFPWAKVFSF